MTFVSKQKVSLETLTLVGLPLIETNAFPGLLPLILQSFSISLSTVGEIIVSGDPVSIMKTTFLVLLHLLYWCATSSMTMILSLSPQSIVLVSFTRVALLLRERCSFPNQGVSFSSFKQVSDTSKKGSSSNSSGWNPWTVMKMTIRTTRVNFLLFISQIQSKLNLSIGSLSLLALMNIDRSDKSQRSQPLLFWILFSHPNRQRFPDELLNDEDYYSQPETHPENKAAQGRIVDVHYLKSIKSGSRDHHNHDRVSDDKYEHDHEGNVGKEGLSPGPTDAEGQHRKEVQKVCEEEEDVTLRRVQQPVVFGYIQSFVVLHTCDGLIADCRIKDSRKSHNHRYLAENVDSEIEQNLKEISETKQGVVGYLYTQFVCRSGEAEDHYEEEITGDIPIEIVEVCGVAIKYLVNNRSGVLGQGVAGHYVEKRKVSGQTRSAFLYQFHH